MAITFASALAGADPDDSSRIPRVPFEKYVLPNGLQVILHEDRSTPIVGVNVWYHVGSKNERPGRTGFAHLFEHMMFQGSQHCDRDYFGPLQAAGGQLNGSTSSDRTNYWETVPSNYLELAIWMESDRMGFLLPAMTEEKFVNQRDVVKNERRQSYENRPYGLVFETLLAAIYPPDHPYSWPTIGSMADLDAATRDDVADFFRRYYHPGNASLCIAGDFDPAEARRLVDKYFGPLPAGPPVKRPETAAFKLDKTQRIRMTDRVSLSRLYLLWPSVPLFAADDAALDMVGEVLAGGKTSRLYRSLVREQQIAQDVQAAQRSGELAGSFMVVVTARPGQDLASIEAAVLEEIGRLKSQPPLADELRRAVNQHETAVVLAMESINGFGGRADRLNLYNVYTGDPGYLAEDFARYLKVTPEDVQRGAREYLGEHFIALEVAPGGELTIEPDPRKPADAARAEMALRLPAEPPLAAAVEIAADEDRRNLPGSGPAPQLRLPPIHRSQLANGMQVLVVENRELPMVSLNVVFPRGRSQEPLDRAGLAGLMASVWDKGTESRTAEQIAEELAMIGASLSLSADADATAARLQTLTHHLPAALEIVADVLRRPAFPEAELERERKLAVGQLLMVRDEPRALAALAMAGALYGQTHPYGKPVYGTPASLQAATRDDLCGFYGTYVRPQDATAVVVGDVDPAEVVELLGKALGDWQSEGDGDAAAFPPLPESPPARLLLIDKPGAAQSVVSVGWVGRERNSPDYFALTVMNGIFGGQFSSRLNLNLREEKGYTYGARSAFSWRVRQPGPFVASASVQTEVTAAALVEFLKEIDGMLGQRPVAEEELEFNRSYLVRGYPADFETTGNVAARLETLVEYGLPDDYYNGVITQLQAVTGADVARVAGEVFRTDRMTVVVVGDRSRIEADLRALPLGKSLVPMQFDQQFQLVPAE